MKPDQERVRNLLTDTVTLLCKNGLQYQTELRVQGVLGITLDNNDVFIVHINEKFGDAIGGTLTIRNDEGDSAKTSVSIHSDTKKSHDAGRGDMPIAVNTKTGEVVHRRRRRSRESSASPALPTNNSQQHILQRPIKRLMPSNKEASPSGVRNRSSVQNSTGNDSVMPNEEEVVEVKVKTEEEDVIVLEEKDSHDRTEMGDTSQHIPHRTDHNAMQDSYPNLSLSELQGNYQPFGEILGVTDSSTNSGADGTAPPPTKRRAASGNTQDSFGGSSEMGPTPDAGGPFITGIIRNETIAGDGAPQTSTTTSWDPSQMPDLSTLTPQDSQMILDSTPGCSAWDTSQQPQVSAATTMTSHTLPNMSEQSSESVFTRYPQKNLNGKVAKGALTSRLVTPVRACGDYVHAFRVVWRLGGEKLAHAWDDIVSQRHLCDKIVAQTPSLQMFVSCISGLFTNAGAGKATQTEKPVYPAVGYWAVFDAAGTDGFSELLSRMKTACPSAQVKRITSLNEATTELSLAATCGTLFAVLKDHNSSFVNRMIRRSLHLTTGDADVGSQPSNAKLDVMPENKYFHEVVQTVDVLRKAGLCIDLEVLGGSAHNSAQLVRNLHERF